MLSAIMRFSSGAIKLSRNIPKLMMRPEVLWHQWGEESLSGGNKLIQVGGKGKFFALWGVAGSVDRKIDTPDERVDLMEKPCTISG